MLLIRGAHDPLIEDWEGDALRQIAEKAGNTGIFVKEIPGAGHDCMENPKAMVDEMLEFLRLTVD